jgi:two-component system sensor histidine kinase RegB
MSTPFRTSLMRMPDVVEGRLRLQTSVRLRWFAVLGQLVTVAVVYLVFGFSMPAGYCLLLIAMSAWLNVFLRVRFPARYRLSPAFATTLQAYDLLQLGGLLYLTGGIYNPFLFLVVAPVTVSAASLPPRNTMVVGAIAAAISALLVVFHQPLPWHEHGVIELPLVYKLGILASVLACMTFLAIYAFRLSKESRQMSAALAATEEVLAREQKLHALDGLAAAAAHELGTPLATIVLVTKELENSLEAGHPFSEDIALLRTQAQRCRDILQKLTRQPSEQDPLHASLSVIQLIEEAAAPYRAGERTLRIDARPSAAQGTPGYTEPVGERRPGVIYGLGNLIENAVEFARSRVEVTARWNEREIVVTIADDGPGFPPDIAESLGEPYVTHRGGGRGRTGRANGKTGLGLGVFIAKTLLERSGATVSFGNLESGGGAEVGVVWSRATFEASASTAGMAMFRPSAPVR